MDRQHLDQDASTERGRRPYWLVAALVLGVAAIVTLAVYNLKTSEPARVSESERAERAADRQAAVSAPSAPRFDVVRVSRGGTGVLAGRAAPGSSVAVLVDGEEVARTVADRNGEWVLILEAPLPAGTVELSLVSHREGAEPVPSDDVVVVSLPLRVARERFSEPDDEGVVAVLTSKSGEGPSRVMQKPGLAAPGEVGDSLTVDTIDFGAEGETVFSGRALPRTDLRVYLDNGFIGETTADDEGRWVLSRESKLAEGEHILRIDQVIKEDDVRLRVVQPFETGRDLDPSKAENRVVVQPGNTLWTIARLLYGRGTRYTLIFQENSEQIVDPDLIYPGQRFELPSMPEDEDADQAQASQ